MDHEKIIHTFAHEEQKTHPGGRKPKPLKTTWMMRSRELPPDRNTISYFAIDEIKGNQLTVAIARTIEAALECINENKGTNNPLCIRPVEITETDLRIEDKIRQQKRAWNSGYGA